MASRLSLSPFAQRFLQDPQASHITQNPNDASKGSLVELFQMIMKIEGQIETLRIQLSQNPKFYPEEIFSYLKNYNIFRDRMKSEQNPHQMKNFFHLDFTSNDQTVINFVNSSRNGIIPYANIMAFVRDRSEIIVIEDQLRLIEKEFHVEQAVLDQVGKQSIISIPNKATPERILNSGNGINYQTFLKLILSHSIPAVRNTAAKRKLIYEPNIQQFNPKIDAKITDQIAGVFLLEIQLNKESETLKQQLAQEPSYNPIIVFSALDSKREGCIDFESILNLFKSQLINITPKDFNCLVRRARIIGNQKTALTVDLTFDDFRILTQAKTAYFKKPIMNNLQKNDKKNMNDLSYEPVQSQLIGNTTNTNTSIIGYSQLGGGQNNSKFINRNYDYRPISAQHLIKTRKLDLTQEKDFLEKSYQPNIPVYSTNNLNLNNLIKSQVRLSAQQINESRKPQMTDIYDKSKYNSTPSAPQSYLQPAMDSMNSQTKVIQDIYNLNASNLYRERRQPPSPSPRPGESRLNKVNSTKKSIFGASVDPPQRKMINQNTLFNSRLSNMPIPKR